jgi:hypothetical protein
LRSFMVDFVRFLFPSKISLKFFQAHGRGVKCESCVKMVGWGL